MTYKCLECGHIFDDGEQLMLTEDRGEFWGEPVSQKIGVCPICKGDYEKTKKCAICGGDFLEEELCGGVCQECIDEYARDIDTCYNIGALELYQVEINSYLATMFSASEINDILLRELREAAKVKPISCSALIDREWFAEMLVEEVK